MEFRPFHASIFHTSALFEDDEWCNEVKLMPILPPQLCYTPNYLLFSVLWPTFSPQFFRFIWFLVSLVCMEISKRIIRTAKTSTKSNSLIIRSAISFPFVGHFEEDDSFTWVRGVGGMQMGLSGIAVCRFSHSWTAWIFIDFLSSVVHCSKCYSFRIITVFKVTATNDKILKHFQTKCDSSSLMLHLGIAWEFN